METAAGVTNTVEPAPEETPPFLRAVLNLSRFHREHEKFYAQEPRATAVELQRAARALQALADRWTRVHPDGRVALNPFEGSEDLNDGVALQLDGVLFMEGQGEPAEITKLKRDLRARSEDQDGTGRWLDDAMRTTWDLGPALFAFPELSDLLGERHRIIANDWQAAGMSIIAGRLLGRAVDVLEQVDFAPAAVRADLAGARHVPGYLYSAAELVDRAADLLSDSAGLVHDNERRWRVFRGRVEQLVRDRTR